MALADLVDSACWWTGAAVLAAGAGWGALSVLWWIIDRAVRLLGLWPDFWRAMQIMWRERARSHD